jgi:hypothetical protein
MKKFLQNEDNQFAIVLIGSYAIASLLGVLMAT